MTYLLDKLLQLYLWEKLRVCRSSASVEEALSQVMAAQLFGTDLTGVSGFYKPCTYIAQSQLNI
ncbi:hypothetical protein NTGHW29_690005 [Candidatus Nitrotoga sp. HW29]|nr:hypothetical protein NTGHW29_690005 [Candidatus Nitrotoga sp. HW29]